MTAPSPVIGIVVLLPVLASVPATAETADERVRALAAELRCVVCQNQSLLDSDADLAKDMRALIQERVAAGDTDEVIVDFLVERYGDFILLQPPFKPATWFLWLGPLAFLLLALALARTRVRRARSRRSDPDDPGTS
ncbi:MAG: cytochrome c-type biogenesis protein CcmH [Rhodospirillales bacterium]|nr:cytochrome c-type biogenesis protein CcmH [Rhodospirillales bacterium]MCY4003922.1 cytochrome c-type biogenesis protein CcmH [Rhodospirillales bacterium]MDE0371361.1 cytochrome c-type biogenesis protein CcmH [Rhodospirillales bacterium]